MTGEASAGPHQNGPLEMAGAPLSEARAAMILVHGRGGTAAGILSLAAVLTRPGLTFLAPQAAGNRWYPHGFMAPIEMNEPGLSSGLRLIADLVAYIESEGLQRERIALLGFSQGACLALEFAARNARRYGAVFGLSGGLIGPDETPREYAGALDGTPAFLGCSDVDPHIPVQRVDETAAILSGLNADVTKRIYPGMGHTVNEDEIAMVVRILSTLMDPARED